MYNYHTELVAALRDVLPVHYEMFLSSDTPVPCISYMELTNYDTAAGETMGYSLLSYQVKVWAHSMAEIVEYAQAVDNALRALGFKRTSAAEMADNQSGLLQKIMVYDAPAREVYEIEQTTN